MIHVKYQVLLGFLKQELILKMLSAFNFNGVSRVKEKIIIDISCKCSLHEISSLICPEREAVTKLENKTGD